VRTSLLLSVLLFTACPQERPCAETCTGCCTSSGRCEGGDLATRCGRLGLACEDCGPEATCSANRCITKAPAPDAGTDGGVACVPGFKGVTAATLVGAPIALKGARNLALGDLDGDGKVDAIAAYSGTGETYVLRGNGDGTFIQWELVTPPVAPVGVAIGRLNSDFLLDAVLVMPARPAILLLNNGDGGFTRAQANTQPDLVGVALGDVDGDGHTDLITPVQELTQGDVWVNLGVGDGTFGAATAVGAQQSVLFTDAADLDGDGKLDFVSVKNGADEVSVVRRAAGGFSAPVSYPTGKTPRSVALGLIDGDDRPDLVAVNSGSDSLTLRPNDGDGTFPVSATKATTHGPQCVAIGDLNGDDKADVVVGGDTLDFFPGLGGGNLGIPTVLTTPTSSLALADVDGNGRLDIVVLGPNRLTTWLRGCW
jgi:hypothetical protein